MSRYEPDKRFLGDGGVSVGQFLAKWIALLEPTMNDDDRNEFLDDFSEAISCGYRVQGSRLTNVVEVAHKGDEATEDELVDALRAFQSLDDLGEVANDAIEKLGAEIEARLNRRRATKKPK